MTGVPYTGNPAYPPPTTVQLEADSDPQRATSYNPGLQDLADQIAYQMHRYGPDRVGTSAAMQAVSDARESELFYVLGFGFYSFTTSAIPANVPVVYVATGMGGGAWVSALSGILFAPVNPPKIISSYVKNAIVQHGPLLVVGTSISDSVSTSPYQNLKDDSAADVAAVITSVGATDTLWLDVGPLMWTVGAATTSKFRVHIVQGSTPKFYEKTFIDPGSGSHPYVQESIRYDSISTDNIQINLEIASVSGTQALRSPTTWGDSRFEWGHFQLIRP